MAEAGPYDPARDLAVLLHAAVRQGFWSPAARGSIGRLARELDVGDFTMASDVETRLREMLDRAGRERAGRDEAAAAATRLHEDAAAFRAEMAGAEADLDGFVSRTLAAAASELPEHHPIRRVLARRPDPGYPVSYNGAI
jgi:hypothetical protein